MTLDSNKPTRLMRLASSMSSFPWLCFVSLIILSACNQSQSPENDKTAEAAVDGKIEQHQPIDDTTASSSTAETLYGYVYVSEQVAAESSPSGYWEKTLHYPQLTGMDKQDIQNAINNDIKRLVDGYQCETPGDQNFDAKVTQSDQWVFSMKYDVMWMCDTMPRPDSDVGAVTYDLSTGQAVSLDSELKDQSAKEWLNDLVAAIIKMEIEKVMGEDASYCPEPESYGDFYLKNSDIVFIASFLSHASSACEVEASVPLVDLRPHLKETSLIAHLISP